MSPRQNFFKYPLLSCRVGLYIIFVTPNTKVSVGSCDVSDKYVVCRLADVPAPPTMCRYNSNIYIVTPPRRRLGTTG